MEIITLKEAKEKGLKFYFTGKPCLRGHLSERIVSGRSCKECTRENIKKSRGKLVSHKYRPNFKLICYGCKKEFIREGQKDINGLTSCRISDTYKERMYCSNRCQKVWYREQGKHRDNERKRYQENPDWKSKVDKRNKIYRDNNREKIAERSRKYAKENRDKINAYKRKWGQKRRDTDFEWRLANALRKRIWEALANGRKSAHTVEFLGAEIEEVAFHLENQFEEGMNWDNYNHEGWHVDHIRPLTSFDLIDYEQQFVCFNWRNLQPMWGLENMAKKDDYTEED